MVKSESLACGGAMTMTLGDDLNFMVLLYGICVSPCGWPGRPGCPVWAVVTVLARFSVSKPGNPLLFLMKSRSLAADFREKQQPVQAPLGQQREHK